MSYELVTKDNRRIDVSEIEDSHLANRVRYMAQRLADINGLMSGSPESFVSKIYNRNSEISKDEAKYIVSIILEEFPHLMLECAIRGLFTNAIVVEGVQIFKREIGRASGVKRTRFIAPTENYDDDEFIIEGRPF